MQPVCDRRKQTCACLWSCFLRWILCWVGMFESQNSAETVPGIWLKCHSYGNRSKLTFDSSCASVKPGLLMPVKAPSEAPFWWSEILLRSFFKKSPAGALGCGLGVCCNLALPCGCWRCNWVGLISTWCPPLKEFWTAGLGTALLLTYSNFKEGIQAGTW